MAAPHRFPAQAARKECQVFLFPINPQQQPSAFLRLGVKEAWGWGPLGRLAAGPRVRKAPFCPMAPRLGADPRALL